MSRSPAVVLIEVGGLGVVEFGILWLAIACLRTTIFQEMISHRIDRATGLSRRRIDHLVWTAPLLTVVSMGVLVAGAFAYFASP